MRCPQCGAAELVRDIRDLPYSHKGESTLISSVKGEFCPACGEVVLDLDEAGRLNAESRSFNRQVDAAIVEPNFVARVLDKLNLGRREASEIFGVDIDSFSRFETGQTKPPLALVQLLRLLERHPELLSEIRH